MQKYSLIIIAFVLLGVASCKNYQLTGKILEADTSFTLKVTCDAKYGSVSIDPVRESYGAGDTVKITAIPVSGYTFNHWSGSETGTSNPLLITVSKDEDITPVFTSYKWTFIVYMCADNDLEEAAIEDFNELEAVDWSAANTRVLVLLDRSPGYDSTNGDWTDTRLYQVQTDPAGDNQTIISKRLDCPVLGLSSSTNTELNMSSTLTLSHLIDFVQQSYPAENYGLLVWGHGTGWRSNSSGTGYMIKPDKAIAWDETSQKYMPIVNFGSAISGKNISVVGFDTCFGSLLEVAYEIRNKATWLVGSEGIIPSSGWDYKSLFTGFLTSDLSSGAFCDVAISQFSTQYSGVSGATISKISLSKINDLAIAFDNFSNTLATGINSQSARNTVLQTIMSNTISYHASSYPTDMYLDLTSFAGSMKNISGTFTTSSSVVNDSSSLITAANNAVVSCWSKEKGFGTGSIGVFFMTLIADNTLDSSHSSAYVKGSSNSEQSSFVQDSQHWVPNQTPKNSSFLDKIFYWTY